MNTIKNVLRANGFITSYVEDEELFTITRNGEGKPTFVRSTRGRWVSQEATFIYDQAGKFTGLSKEIDTAMLTVLVSEANDSTGGGGASSTESLSGPRTITADDDQKQFTCTTALTITIPELLSPRPSFIVNAPPTGNVSLDPTGAAQLNGATTTLTRSRANNPAGFVVTAYAESDGYGVSGS